MKKNLYKQPAVFLDRDGTLIEEVNYLSRVDDLRLFPTSAEAITELKKNGFLVIVVTNQSGIGRNIFDVEDMHRVNDEMNVRLGGQIDAIYFCPHLPCDGCRCRKPEAGMIESAIADFDIDLQDSWMIGDKRCDIELGRNLEIRTALVLTGYGLSNREQLQGIADIIAADIGQAAKSVTSTAK